MEQELEQQNNQDTDLLKRDEKGRLVKGTPPGPGRPKGSVSIVTELRKKLESIHPDQKRTYLEIFAESVLDDALMIDGPSRKLVMQYIEGLPQQKMELTHIIPKPLDDIPKDNSLQENKGYEEEDKSLTGGNSSIQDSIDSNLPDS